ncbi:MAG: hypothetical protein A2140_03810 [Candidatus Muproteobacteria bacterium RBG_16_62_13]|uniref:protein O-GlcNAc transferase n=1 Tax=Candidatus Muproteobacteria bacterium RBG_16_62_13 TaxID=1817756 RepID=A0A1F6T3V3_9PROT|nr:MAG: hypothetical protein A2140_03810 [Candidatus Muproteobacteria bacterium RBG_16_62_13]
MAPLATKQAAETALRAGHLPEAAALYESLCARNPKDADAWATLGDLRAALGQFDQSAKDLQRAVALRPQEAGWWGNLGASQLDLGKPDEAIRSFHESLRLNANQPGVHYNLGAALARLGRLDDAVRAYQAAINLNPGFAEAWLNLGSLHSRRREYHDAMQAAREALRLRPGYPEAHNNLGQALAALDRHEEAIVSYREALKFNPDYPEAHGNLAASLTTTGLISEAAAHAREALRRSPHFGEAANNLGNALIRLGEISAAIQVLSDVQADSPAYASARDNLLLALNYDPARTPENIADAHREWGRQFPVPTSPTPRPRQERLRIGYLSPDFSLHSVAFFIEPVLRHHNREQFEITAYADVSRADAVTQRLRGHVEHWCEVHTLNDPALCRRIRDDGIDILVDLAGHLRHNRLRVFAERAAPIQATYLGYPNTTGLEAMDFCITDDILDPPGSEVLYTEKLLRLPTGFACYQPPDGAPPVAPPPAIANGYITFGSFHTLAKINAAVVERWSSLLQRLPDARLRLQTFGLSDPSVREKIHNAFAAHGIATGRIDMHPESSLLDYLRAHGQVDIGLDTLPWSGHTTTCHALWMGVPTITLAGNRHAGRLGASALKASALPEFVALNQTDWQERILLLAKDTARLKSLRLGLRHQMLASTLCDGAGFVTALESAYRSLVRTGTQAQPPAHSRQ